MACFSAQEEDKTLNNEANLHSSSMPKDLAEKPFGFCASQVIVTGFNIGVFDVIRDTTDSISAKEIAKQLQTNEEATVRLLDTLVSLDLLKKDTRDEVDFYDNTSISDNFLARKSPNSIKGVIPMITKSYKLYENLEWAVRDGENQWRRTYNGFLARFFFLIVDVYRWLFDESWDMFSLIYLTKKGVMMFLEGLRGTAKPEAERLMSAFDLSGFDSMCDLGGMGSLCCDVICSIINVS